MSTNISSPVPPNLRALLDAYKQEVLGSISCVSVGAIVSFDPAIPSASVKLAISRVVGNTLLPYPVMTDCPVYVPSGGGAALTLPIKAGDSCLVLFNDLDLDNWFVGGTDIPNTNRSHSLSDGLVIVGFRNKQSALSGYSMTDAQLRLAGGVVGIDGGTGRIDIHSPNGSLLSGLDSLCTALDSLCTALVNWTDTRGDHPNPATQAQITAAKNALDSSQTLIDSVLK